MIADFLSSWQLFHNSYLAGWLIAFLLPLLGVLVVARDQIFVGAAISQASLVGIAVGMHVGAWTALAEVPWLHSDAFLSLSAGAAAVLASLLTTRSEGRADSPESVTGWVFLVGGSFSVLLLSHSPHGMEQIHRLLSSTIIGAERTDVWIFLGILAVTLLVLWLRWRPLLLMAIDPEMGAAVGLRVGLWSALFSIWLGIVIGFSNRVAGVIYTFGLLVLPALVTRNLCREVGQMVVVAPVLGLVSAVVAFVLAHGLDYPPGQTATGLLCLVLPLSWAFRRLRS